MSWDYEKELLFNEVFQNEVELSDVCHKKLFKKIMNV